ncbi:hypothetical protein ACHAXS_000706 [Conticribra weissflogii]
MTNNEKNNKNETNNNGNQRNKNQTKDATTMQSEQDHKIQHSLLLTRLFEEAAPKFQEIRRHLNDIVLERQAPKSKSRKTARPSRDVASSSYNSSFDPSPTDEGLGGKAGKSHFVVRVGDVQNLYKTTKSHSHCDTDSIPTLDLHGLTRREALTKLDDALREWKAVALSGSHPWVISAVIVCGCGNQVLAEVVERWIRDRPDVANAPRKKKPR